MPNVISSFEWWDIEDRYSENGWINQRDQDIRENSLRFINQEIYDLRIPQRELSEWFDDFYAYIDKSLHEYEIPKRIREQPKPTSTFTISPSDPDDDESLWTFVPAEPKKPTFKQAIKLACPIHDEFVVQRHKMTGSYRLQCKQCETFVEFLQPEHDYILRDQILKAGGEIHSDQTFSLAHSVRIG